MTGSVLRAQLPGRASVGPDRLGRVFIAVRRYGDRHPVRRARQPAWQRTRLQRALTLLACVRLSFHTCCVDVPSEGKQA
eukprot:364362-Chlamydomonas_euryale.AAC.12